MKRITPTASAHLNVGAYYDRVYNNRALVPDFADYLNRWKIKSAQTRQSQTCTLNIAYGTDASETLDIFYPPTRSAQLAPVLVFLHGGYWRALDKADHSFIAPVFTQEGACVVVPNYALCPGTATTPVTVPSITLQMVKALAWVYQHITAHGGSPQRIVVAGHSAGGHLAAMLLNCQWHDYGKSHSAVLPRELVKAALSISGLYELDSIRQTPHLQTDLRLCVQDALKTSPAWMPAPEHGQLYTVAGSAESAAFLQHNELIQTRWGKARVPVCELLPGRNHFSALEALVEPDHRLHQLARQLLNPPATAIDH